MMCLQLSESMSKTVLTENIIPLSDRGARPSLFAHFIIDPFQSCAFCAHLTGTGKIIDNYMRPNNLKTNSSPLLNSECLRKMFY